MVRRQFVVAGLTLTLSVAASAQVTVLRPYTEKENPNTPVRGHAVVGVALVPRADDQEKERLFVYTPRRQGQTLSVDVTTANGRVQGEALVRLDGPAGHAGDWTELAVPKRFRRSDPEGLAVGVQTPGDANGAFYIASWGRAPQGRLDDLELWVYVNRGRSPQAVLYWNPDEGKGQACTTVTSTTNLRFNAICKVRFGDVRPNGRLTLVRRDGGSSQPQDVVLVR